jgi:hypothetical protein
VEGRHLDARTDYKSVDGIPGGRHSQLLGGIVNLRALVIAGIGAAGRVVVVAIAGLV